MSEIKSQMQELITAVKDNVSATKEVNISVNGLKTEQSTLMRWALLALIIIALGQTGLEIAKAIIYKELPATAEVKK